MSIDAFSAPYSGGRLSVCISGTRPVEDDPPYTAYDLYCSFEKDAVAVTWTVTTRYSELRETHLAVCDRYPEFRLPSFPRRALFGSMDPAFISDRRTALRDYLWHTFGERSETLHAAEWDALLELSEHMAGVLGPEEQEDEAALESGEEDDERGAAEIAYRGGRLTCAVLPDTLEATDSDGTYHKFVVRLEWQLQPELANALLSAPLEWEVAPRYRRFRRMHHALQHRFPDRQLPRVPRKRRFGALAPAFVRQRRLALHAYLVRLLTEVPEAAHTREVDEMLQLSMHVVPHRAAAERSSSEETGGGGHAAALAELRRDSLALLGLEEGASEEEVRAAHAAASEAALVVQPALDAALGALVPSPSSPPGP